MKSWKTPTAEAIESTLSKVKKETDRQYFFSRLNNPLWLIPLEDRGFFSHPPSTKTLPNGGVQFSFWPELTYLKNISQEVPEEVARIVLELPTTDNPRVYDEIIEIVLSLHGELSSSLLPKLLEASTLDHFSLYNRFSDILIHWSKEKEFDAALVVIKELVKFQPDPNSKEKQKSREKDSDTFGTNLEPIPKFDQWEYEQLLEKGVESIVEYKALEVAEILVESVNELIELRIHPKDIDRAGTEDLSEIWCRRLTGEDQKYRDSKVVLVKTLTSTCMQVFNEDEVSVAQLNELLSAKNWKLFYRLRQQLYASNTNEQTLPWIREIILNHADYSKWTHHYEFQLMIRKASEHFNKKLLDTAQISRILNEILNGPSKSAFQKDLGDDFAEEKFIERQSFFHWQQLRPFKKLLTNDHKTYFEKLSLDHKKHTLTDDEYSPYGRIRSGFVSRKSPISKAQLEGLSDADLLQYLNEWDDEHRDNEDWLVEVTINALADEFQSFFEGVISLSPERVNFWIDHREDILRPIHIESILRAFQQLAKDSNLKNTLRWVELCDWVLAKPDTNVRSVPNWRGSRRAVLDIIEACVDSDSETNLDFAGELGSMLDKLCSQSDSRLDGNKPVILNSDDQIAEAINNIRSRALDVLLKYEFWVLKHLPQKPVPLVKKVLESRFNKDSSFPLSLPEIAILGMNYWRIYKLDQDWAREYKEMIFDRENPIAWIEAFGSFLRYTRPIKDSLEVFRNDFDFAIEHFEALSDRKISPEDGFLENLGQHIFSFYMWDLFPLTGESSLIERLYSKLSIDTERLALLFDHVGRSLNNSDKNIDQKLIKQAVAFFDYRYEAQEPQELKRFTFWLDADCLEPEWRLSSYAKILEICDTEDLKLSIELKTLERLVKKHDSLVMDCFNKITLSMNQSTNIYIQTSEAKSILKIGLASTNKKAKQHAEEARENLLRLGRFDFLDLK